MSWKESMKKSHALYNNYDRPCLENVAVTTLFTQIDRLSVKILASSQYNTTCRQWTLRMKDSTANCRSCFTKLGPWLRTIYLYQNWSLSTTNPTLQFHRPPRSTRGSQHCTYGKRLYYYFHRRSLEAWTVWWRRNSLGRWFPVSLRLQFQIKVIHTCIVQTNDQYSVNDENSAHCGWFFCIKKNRKKEGNLAHWKRKGRTSRN